MDCTFSLQSALGTLAISYKTMLSACYLFRLSEAHKNQTGASQQSTSSKFFVLSNSNFFVCSEEF